MAEMHQYPSDRLTGHTSRVEDVAANPLLLDESRRGGYHWDQLHDLDEDLAGEITDPRTGQRIDNSTRTTAQDMHDYGYSTREAGWGSGRDSEDLEELERSLPRGSDAAQWLRDNRHRL